MSELANAVRLVQCPKCGNLLPEVTDLSVYQCGGCGAVLRAGKGNGSVDRLSDEGRVQGFSERSFEKSENLGVSEMSRMILGHVADDDVKSNGSSSNRVERRRFSRDTIETRGAGLTATANKWAVDGGDMEIDNIIGGGVSHGKIDRNFEEVKSRMGTANGLQKPGEQWDRRFGGTSEMDAFPGPPRNNVVSASYSTSKYLEEEPLKYQLQSYDYREPLNKRNYLDGSDNIGFLGENQAEILLKLEELKLQVLRSGDVVDKSKDKFPLDRRIVPPDPHGYSDGFLSDGCSAMNRHPLPYSIADHHAAGSSYSNHYAETSPFMNRHGFYPPPQSSSHIPEFGNPSSSHFLPRAPFQQKPLHTQFSRAHIDSNVVPVDSYYSYRPDLSRHHPSCSCFHCYEQYKSHGQGRVPTNAYGAKQLPDVTRDPAALYHDEYRTTVGLRDHREVYHRDAYSVKQLSDVTKDPTFYHDEYPNTVGLRDHREVYDGPTSFKFKDDPSHHRWPSAINSEASSFAQKPPAKIPVTTGSRRCHPVAGGAPFLSCHNCHQLLQLPKKVVFNDKPVKMRCGACSTLIEVTVDSKSLNVTVDSVANRANEKHNISSSDDLNECSSGVPGNPNKASVNFASEDFDSSGFNFQSMDREVGSTSNGVGGSIKSNDPKSPHSTLSSSSEKEKSLNNMPAMNNKSNSPKILAKGLESPPPAGSSLQEYFDYSNKYHLQKRYENGNKSWQSVMDKTAPAKDTFRENPINDTSATEIEISSNEYANNTGTTLDSREGDQLRAKKAADSFFANMVKNNFRDTDRSTEDDDQGQCNVTVNGNLISERLIRKASRQAGPICPGHYWYDFRAGFWGVIGGPCLGILPPFIEEFNYPMAENCTGGGTSIFVNGRELHPKDLNLLANRGLPTDSNRSFILEISGRILDADTGEELESLGKLAPTIERLKRGFGMKDPNTAA